MPSATAPTPSRSSSPPASGRPEGADPALAIYVHWPFCLAKCPYCDFNSHVREAIDQQRWRDAYLREIAHAAPAISPADGPVTSIFFGGGTPSLMAPDTVGRIIDAIAGRWGLAVDAEITLEANPTSVEAGRLADYSAAGVNRASLGVQALDDAALRFLGRAHSAKEALAAVDKAARVFDRFSFDLIYGRPGQGEAAWRAELAAALDHAGDHLSVYQLTIEPGTVFHTRRRQGRLTPMDADAAAGLYEATLDLLVSAGLPAYEISNHARPGGESRHNLAYWRYGSYVGIGPGAHGREGAGAERMAVVRRRGPEEWLAAVERDGHGTAEAAPLSSAERRLELMLMGLRLAEGVPESRLRAETGDGFADALDLDRVHALVQAGLLDLSSDSLSVTPAGALRLDAVLAEILL